MDNFESFNSSNKNPNNPLSSDDNPGSIPFDDDAGGTGISHSPLDLGGSRPVEITKTEPTKQVVQKPAAKAISTGSTERIVGIKTFFTKLHPGAINFLDEQITDWLKNNPDISIKRTNVTVGEIQAKKTEPNILITVWY
ncbi:MAG: hypothetical protein JW715_03225 [Sedimentisphaerales bacterium]|nr:hypothetical protein [Sedimentisphaerales bacterium]